jgi:hypothetical protein
VEGHTSDPAFVAECDDGTGVLVCATCLGAYLGMDSGDRRDFQLQLADRLLPCRGRTRWVGGVVDAILAEHNTAFAKNLWFELRDRFADTSSGDDNEA